VDDASQVYIEDLRDDFVKDYVFWSVKVRPGGPSCGWRLV
jgi:argininosuccinate synthase